ncbi:MAG: hypothetical protein WCD53_23190 [Microcoleus sp.]
MPAKPAEYTIYLVNQSSSRQTFWCFLEPPEILPSDPAVFANSSVSLAVGSLQPGKHTFTIPVQYVVEAGASSKAVGLGVKISSIVTNDANLTDTWEADYVTVPPPQGPTMQKLGAPSPANTITIKSNAFDQGKNEAAGWFSNMSFGIQTEQGFIGMTWSPNPQQTRTLTPKLKFYVAVGSYGDNTLASWTTVSNNSSEAISVPSSFQYNEATVTYTSTGGWLVTPGKPPATSDYIGSLIQSHLFISKAHADLVALAQLSPSYLTLLSSSSQPQKDTVETVTWKASNSYYSDADTELTLLAGTITVTTALVAAFSVFVFSGVTFNIQGDAAGLRSFNFTYTGDRSAQAVRDLLVAGAKIILR